MELLQQFNKKNSLQKPKLVIPPNTNTNSTLLVKKKLTIGIENQTKNKMVLTRPGKVAATITVQQPNQAISFVLRNIDPYQILKKYNDGFYSQMDIPNDPIFEKDSGTNNKKNNIYYELNDGKTRTVVAKGYDDCKKAKETKSPFEVTLMKHGLCEFCRKNLGELSENEYPVGVPYSIEKRGQFYVFETIEKTCSFECCLALARTKVELKQFIPNVYTYFNIIHPQKELIPSQNPNNHERNGGHLNDEEYYGTTHRYFRSPNIISLPSITEYTSS